ncbi:MAG: hypothetical protein JSS13_11900 [Proteobacteria bacterium]|nr:hypothetical protein [Pseudomonadota bacterium]
MKRLPERDADETAMLSRRKLLVAAAAGAGLAFLPGLPALAAGSSVRKAPLPSIAMGYCNIPASGSLTDASLGDALSVAPIRGNYVLRVVGAATDQPLAIGAHYGANAEHCFWQAWITQNQLQCSPPSAIRWAANSGKPLPLTVALGAGTAVSQVPARSGIYALIVVPQAQRMPAWSSLGLEDSFTDGVAMRLVERGSSAPVALPYALFSVRPLGGTSVKA